MYSSTACIQVVVVTLSFLTRHVLKHSHHFPVCAGKWLSHAAMGLSGTWTTSLIASSLSKSYSTTQYVQSSPLNSFLRFLFPLIACGFSVIVLAIQLLRKVTKYRSKAKAKVIGHDDLVETDSAHVNGDDRENWDGLTLQKTVSRTNVSTKEVDKPRGELLLVSIEVVALVGNIGINAAALLTHAWDRHSVFSPVAGIVIWCYVLFLVAIRLLRYATRRPYLPRVWNHTALLYSTQWLIEVLLFRSTLVHPRSALARSLVIAEFCLTTVLLLIASTTRKGNEAVVLEYEGDIEPSREPLASVASLWTFAWVDAIVYRGYKKTLELADVWNLPLKEKAANVLADFRQTKKTSSLAWRLLKYFKGPLLLQGAWAAFANLFSFAPTLLLRAILQYVEDPDSTPANAAWFYVILLFFAGAVQALGDGQSLWIGRKVCIKLRAIIIGEIYAKALRRKAAATMDTNMGEDDKSAQDDTKKSKKDSAKKDASKPTGEMQDDSDAQANNGTIINLMAIDSFKVSDISAYLHFLWACVPVQLVAALVLLYSILGLSSFAGIALMAAATPLNIYIANQFRHAQKRIMAATDARIHSTNEVLQNIRIIKYFAWEERFAQIVDEKRREELKAIRFRYILWALAACVWSGLPIIITFASFLLYTTVEKKDLVPSVAFPALSMFNLLRIPLDQLADMIARVQDSKVSVDRVQKFLEEEETEKYDQLRYSTESEAPPKIGLENATLTWGSKSEASKNDAFRLLDINVSFQLGELNVISGATGSGKTSLLMALLGEMKLLEGSVHLPGGYIREHLRVDPETSLTESVAYCAQQAWLVNDTVKENILFASPYDSARYKGVLHACALERDLEILDAGDQTLVGDKGVALSGGQKQRISLARALYCNSRHVLLDDCLSAVDSHTAKHIFAEAIMGPLMMHRTCILVTHNASLVVPNSKFVIVLENGKAVAQGAPKDVIATGALGDDFLKSKPGSVLASRAMSRTASEVDNAKTKMDGANGANGSIDVKNPASSKKPDTANANIRTESKAEGSVSLTTIRMYLAAMGPWPYWTIALFSFLAQQVSSVGTNIWVREWSNSYHTSRTQSAVAGHNFSASHLVRRPPSFTVGSLYQSSLLDAPVNAGGFQQTLRHSSDVNVKYYLGIYVLIGVVFLFISLFRELVLFWGSLEASRKIHTQLLNAILRAKFRFFDSTPAGQLMNRFSKDVEAVDQEVAPTAIGVLHCFASVVTIIILISVITPGFLVAGFFIGLLYVAVGMFYIHSSRDLKRLESVQRSPLYQQFGETLSGVVTIRAYGDENRFIRDNYNRINTQSRPFIYLWATNRWLAFRIDIAGALVAFFAGAFIVRSVGYIDAGAAGLSLSYAITFTENVLWLVRLYAQNEQNMNSVERIKEYLEVDQEAAASIPETKPPGNWPSHGAVEFIGYSTRYRDDLEPVLKKVTFEVRPAEKVGIVGRTGAGKSSLALALFRGLEATEGKILIDGVDIGLIGLQDLREAITIVPQDPTLFTGTIRSNLDPFGIFTDDEIFTALRRVQLLSLTDKISTSAIATPADSAPPTPTTPSTPGNGDAMLASTAIANPVTFSTTREGTEVSDTPTLVPPDQDPNSPVPSKLPTNTRAANKNLFRNLSSHIAESGSNLSQGQRQLLCLARALLKSPRVLMMDEATASIDYSTDAKLQDTLREIKDNTIITIAHRLQTIIDYDKVLVLEAGEVVEFDDPWALIQKGDGIFRGMCEQSGDLDGLMEAAENAHRARRLIDDE